MLDQNADYCPPCSLRQRNGQPRWWQIYCTVTSDDNPVRQQYEDDLAPSSLSQVSPAYYEHMLDVFSLALLRNAVDGLPIEEIDVGTSGVAEDPQIDPNDAEWLREHYPKIEDRHRNVHPASTEERTE